MSWVGHVVPVSRRSAIALGLASLIGIVAYGWPLFMDSGFSGHSADAPYVFVILLPLVVAVVLAELSSGGLDAKAVAMLGVLAAVGTALRALSPGTGGFEPTFFLVVLAGRVFGAGFGFSLGAVTIVASALATGGVGPWMPFQLLGLAWTGLFAGLLPAASGRAERWMLAAYAGIGSLAYGLLINLSFWPFSRSLPAELSFDPGGAAGENLAHYASFYIATSFGWDCMRVVVNAVLVLLVGRVVLATLRRAARRAAFDAPVRFPDALPGRTPTPRSP